MRTKIELPTVKVKVKAEDGVFYNAQNLEHVSEAGPDGCQSGSANIPLRAETPETVPSAGPHVEIIYDLDESLDVVRRHFSLSDFQDELDRRYPMLKHLEIDIHYGLKWEDVIEPLFIELRSLRTSLKRGRMKAKLDRVRSNVGFIEDSLVFPPELGSRVSPIRPAVKIRSSLGAA
jgi:hypothetical protein